MVPGAFGDIWFHDPKLFDQLRKSGPIVTTPLAASSQIFHWQPNGFVEEQYQPGEIVGYSKVIEIASEPGI
jgi:hypothetical protein